MVRERRRLPLERWWPSAEQLAGVYSDHVRDDDPGRGAGGRSGVADPDRVAAPVSPAVQRTELQLRQSRQVFPLHRIERSKVPPGRDQAVSGEQKLVATGE